MDERFQSTPPSGERSDMPHESWQRPVLLVSIHAPLRREERLQLVRPALGGTFQSTPPSGERSDAARKLAEKAKGEFQSTPPSGERSDMSRARATLGYDGFNPRPPPERGATRAPTCA